MIGYFITMSIDYHKEFCNLHENYNNNNLRSIENHLSHYEIIEEVLGFQSWLNTQVANVYNKDMEYGKNHFSEASVHGLFTLNLLSLYTAFLTLPRNLINQTITNIRTVYESLPKMYYVSFYPENCGKILLREQIEGKKGRSREILQSSNVKKICEIYDIKYSEDLLNELNKKFDYSWIRRQIYSEGQIEQQRKTYGLFSTSSHGSMIRVRQMRDYSKEEIGDLFELIELLSFFNINCELNGHRKMIEEEKFPVKEVIDFSEKLRAKLVRGGKMHSLFPDRPEIAKKVMLHPPGKPWE